METIKLDLIPGKKMPSLHASQFDDGRDYHIDLTENRVPYTLDGTETISVIIRKCDNTLVSMDIANTFANKSYLEFEVVEQMTACAGFNYGEIILEKNGDRLGSLNFYLQVEAAPDENGITSQSEINNLARQVHDIVVEELEDNGAEETGYDNTESGLEATNVQDAIDEVNTKIENIPSVDAYTKQESDQKYATKTALQEAVNEVNQALTEKADKNNFDALQNAVAIIDSRSDHIYGELTFNVGYMGKDGVVDSSSSTYRYSNKIPVNVGDVITTDKWFRFITAFSGDTAIKASGADNVSSFTIPQGIDGIVITINTEAADIVLSSTTIEPIEKQAVDELTEDVDTLQSDVSDLNDVLTVDTKMSTQLVNGAFTETTLTYWQRGAKKIIYCPCRPNLKYTITKTLTPKEFRIAYVKSVPVAYVEQPVYGYVEKSASDNYAEFVTGEGALMLLVCVGSDSATVTGDDMLADMKITETSLQVVDTKARRFLSDNEAYLPNYINIVTNKDYEIYHNQIVPNAENYTFKWSFGTNYGDRIRFNIPTAGDTEITCDIYNPDMSLAKTLRTTIRAKAVTSASISLMSFGDSLTNHCKWQSELVNMCGTITTVGSRSNTVEDSSGNNRLINDEGRSGFSSFNYTSGTPYDTPSDTGGVETPHNRWYDTANSKFSTAFYFANHFPNAQTEPNAFTFFLGMNDLVSNRTVAECVANIKSMLDDITTVKPNLKIVVITPQLRFLKNLSGLERSRFTEFARSMESLCTNYQNAVFLPLLIGMDSVNNYPQNTITLNTRNTGTEPWVSDIAHPSNYGYWQIADYILGALSYLFT